MLLLILSHCQWFQI